MPCYNGDDSFDRGYNSAASDYRSEARRLKETVERFEAVLCGIMQLDPTIVDRIDWKEVGITKQQHMNWWKQHQKEDAARKSQQELAKKLRVEQAAIAREARERALAQREARKIKLRQELAKLEEQDARKAKKKVVKGKK